MNELPANSRSLFSTTKILTTRFGGLKVEFLIDRPAKKRVANEQSF